MPVFPMPNGDAVNFPDGTTQEQVNSFIADKFGSAPAASTDDPIGGSALPAVPQTPADQVAADINADPLGMGTPAASITPTHDDQGHLKIIIRPAHSHSADLAEPEPEQGRTVFDQTLQGLTGNFSDEITDPIGAVLATAAQDPAALLSGDTQDPGLAEALASARGDTQAILAAEKKNHPVTSFASNAGGVVLGALGPGGFAKNAVTKVAPAIAEGIGKFVVAHPRIASGMAGAMANNIFTAGEGTGSLPERDPHPFVTGGVGGAAGVGGGLVASGLSKVARNPVVQDVIGHLAAEEHPELNPSHYFSATDQAAIAPPAAAAPPLPFSAEDISSVVPLTAGQASGSIPTLRAERAALAAGSQRMKDALQVQNASAMKPFDAILGDSQPITQPDLSIRAQDENLKALGIIKGNYDAMQERAAAGYAQGAEAGGAAVPAAALGQAAGAADGQLPARWGSPLLDRFYTTAAVNQIAREDAPGFFRAFDKLQNIVDGAAEGKQSSSTVTELENWKKNALNAVDVDRQNISPGAAKNLRRQLNADYDGFLDDLIKNDILSGNEKAIAGYRAGRSEASQAFKFYQTAEGVQKLLDGTPMTGVEASNVLQGAAKNSVGKNKGVALQRWIDLAGENAPAFIDAAKKGAYAKILESSVVTKGETGTVQKAIDFKAMHRGLNGLVSNKEFFETLFSPEEQAAWKAYNQRVGKIADAQDALGQGKGTGSKLADIAASIGWIVNNPLFRAVPVVGAGTGLIEKGFTMQAEALVRGKANKGLGEFMQNAVTRANPAAAYYGGRFGGALTSYNGKGR